MNGGDETFPAALDRWTSEDWQEYRRRVQDGEGSVRAMDATRRRRTREAEMARWPAKPLPAHQGWAPKPIRLRTQQRDLSASRPPTAGKA